jgi:polyisoprenoid-binding protein YceI
MSISNFLRRPRTWLIAIPIVVLLAVVVAPWAYINFIKEEAPERLALTDRSTATTVAGAGDTTSPGSIEGEWTATTGSTAGYRIKEVLFGQDTEAAGRTSDVTGELVIQGTTVRTAAFSVDLTTVASDESRRDRQFHGRIMNTAQFPTATFQLMQPITLASIPEDGVATTTAATGSFTIHGVTKTVTFDLAAQRSGSTIEINGSIPFALADYEIPEASFGPASVQDNGEIEFLLVLTQSPSN